jgi:hypothetical protein
MMEALCSSKTSVLMKATWHYNPEDGILHSHHCENLKSYILALTYDQFLNASSVNIGIEYKLDSQGSITTSCTISLFSSVQNGSGAQPRSIESVLGMSSSQVKRGHEAHHSPPTNAMVKNGGTISPLIHIFRMVCLINCLIKHKMLPFYFIYVTTCFGANLALVTNKLSNRFYHLHSLWV